MLLVSCLDLPICEAFEHFVPKQLLVLRGQGGKCPINEVVWRGCCDTFHRCGSSSRRRGLDQTFLSEDIPHDGRRSLVDKRIKPFPAIRRRQTFELLEFEVFIKASNNLVGGVGDIFFRESCKSIVATYALDD